MSMLPPVDAAVEVRDTSPGPSPLDPLNHQPQNVEIKDALNNPVNTQDNGHKREGISNLGGGSIAGVTRTESPISLQDLGIAGAKPPSPSLPPTLSQEVAPDSPQPASQHRIQENSEAISDLGPDVQQDPPRQRERERTHTPPPISLRHFRSAYHAHQANTTAPNPYAGMGLYATPQLYASPLPVRGSMPPPPDNSYIYTQPTPRSFVNSLPPPPGMTPHSIPFMQPPHAQPTSSNVVAAAAGMTPEMKSNPNIEVGHFSNNNPYRLPNTSRNEISTGELHNRGTFAESNPYHLTNHSRRSTVELHPPYPEWKPGLSEWQASSRTSYPERKPWSRSWNGPDSQNGTWNGYQVPSTGQGLPSTFQPFTPFAALSPLPLGANRQQIHDTTFPSHFPYISPAYPTRAPQRQMTATDVISAAVNAPPPEKRQTDSGQVHDPYTPPSAHRRDTLDGERVPIHLSAMPRRDTTSPPPSGWGGYNEQNSHRRPRRHSYSDSDSSDYSVYEAVHKPPLSRHSRPTRRTSSPGYSRHLRKRRRRRSYSPFKYSQPQPPVIIQTPNYVQPPSVVYANSANIGNIHSPYKRGFWHRLGTFFRSPFDGGRPTSFRTPYPRAVDKPAGLFFYLEVIIGQIYFHVLLRLPSLYFSRVSRIFDEANLSLFEIAEMVFETAGTSQLTEKPPVPLNPVYVSQQVAPKIRPQYERLKNSWEAFIDALIREWETFNIVSVMLLTAILTILQINTAASDPVTRYAALFSLICSLMSLLFGCMYIIRFGTMRKTYAAAEWAKSALGTSRSDVWNVWVLLSMPVVWLAWSIILFIVAIMSFVWRTTADNDNASSLILSTKVVLVIRIIMSSVLGLGLANTFLITNTFRHYGEALDQDWRTWIEEWHKAKDIESRYANLLDSGKFMPFLGSEPLAVPPPVFDIPPSASGPWIKHSDIPPNAWGAGHNVGHHPQQVGSERRAPSPSSPPAWGGPETFLQQQQLVQTAMKDGNFNEAIWLPKYFHTADNNLTSSSSSSSDSTSPPPQVRRSVSSRYPRRVRRRRHDSTRGVQPAESSNWTGRPSAPPAERTSYADRPEGASYLRRFDAANGINNTDNRVRFRSPLASAQDSSTAFGGSEWGAQDSSYDDRNSPRVVRPSSSSTGEVSGMIPESGNVQMQRGSALRQRQWSSHAS